MKKFSVTYTFILSLLVYAMALGPVFGATEQRRVTQPDIEWGPSTDNVTSAGGHVGGKLPRYFSSDAFTDNLTLYGNDLITRGPWVDPRGYHDANGVYFKEGNTGTQNRDALQAAFDNAITFGSGGWPVRIPGGAFYMTGTVDTKGVPFEGAGPERTKFFPTTSESVFILRLGGGETGNFSINYTGTLGSDPGAVAIQLHDVSQARLHNITVWNPYRAFQLLTTYGMYGNIWQTSFDHVIVSGPYNYAFYIDSTSDSTTLRWSNSHVYGRDFLYGHTAGNDNLSKGWYSNNVTTVLLSNCSMDGGDGSANGSVISFTNGHQIILDTFHLESFKQTAGGTSSSPIFFDGGMNVSNFFTTSHDVDVGAGNTAYLFRGAYPSTFILGSYRALAPVVTSGTSKLGNLASSQSVNILPVSGGAGVSYTRLDSSQFNLRADTDDYNAMVRLSADQFNEKRVVQHYGKVVSDNTAKVLMSWPLVAGYGPSGIIYVNGFVGGSASSFSDVIVVTATITPVNVAVIGSDNVGSPPTRTYTWASDNVSIQLGGADSYYTHAHGTATYYW